MHAILKQMVTTRNNQFKHDNEKKKTNDLGFLFCVKAKIKNAADNSVE